jgi:hypothetical protein
MAAPSIELGYQYICHHRSYKRMKDSSQRHEES